MTAFNDVENVLLIGASGGIAQACLNLLLENETVKSVTAVSRSQISLNHPKLITYTVPEYNEENINLICQKLEPGSIDLAICTLGVLHTQDNNGQQALFPEKKIEDLSAKSLQHYFAVNSIIPALWLKHLITKMKRPSSLSKGSHIILLSARVGSIGDNQLGGWYGYRASKAALNMLVKTAQVEYQRRCPGCDLVLYHPGTVNTPLSEPFQRNVKPEKLFTPEFTASRLFDILNNKPNTSAPFYLDWQHQTIKW